MRGWIKRFTWLVFAWLVFGLIVLVAGVAAAGVMMAELRLSDSIDVKVAPAAVPADTSRVAQGRYPEARAFISMLKSGKRADGPGA